MYIAIAGNIGCGKTSLTKILSERTGAKAYFEESDNPYIGDFYDDMNRWSFNLQIYFLGQRIRQAKEILATGSDLIQDRTIYEDAYIFAANLHESGLMTTRDYNTYLKIFDLATGLIARPDLLIYLKASVPTLIHQIRREEVPALLSSGIIGGGMIPKIQCCVDALEHGVHRAHILDGRIPHSILTEMLSHKGIGTMLWE